MRPFPTLWFSDAAIMRYVEMFFRRRWLFIIPAVTGLVFGVVIGGLLPKVYQSSALIMVDEEKIMNPLIQGLAISTPAIARVRTLREEILSWDRLVRLVQELGLGARVKNQGDLEHLIATLREEIIVQMRGPNLIRISYESPEPAEAQRVVKAVMTMFIEENIKAQTREAGTAIEFLQGQLKVYRRKIKEAEITQMENRLKGLLNDSTEAHPLVKQLRQQAAQAKVDMDELERTDPAPALIVDPMFEKVKQMVVANPQGVEQVDAPTGMDPSLFNLYVLLSQPQIGMNSNGINAQIYNQLLGRLETAKITQQLDASKEGTRYTVLDPPRLPLKPAKPNRFLVALFGAFLGAMTGAGIIMLIEMADRSFHTVDEVAQFLQVPVIGAINTIWTNDEVQQRQVKQRFATVAVCGVLVTVLLGSFLIGLIHH